MRLEKNGKRLTTIYIDMVSVDQFGKEYKEVKLFDEVLNKYAQDPSWVEDHIKVQARNCGYNV